MKTLPHIFEQNRQWSAEMKGRDPTFFDRLAQQQTPKILWIGCADSRVPANQICGLDPGEVFVHRNVANLVVHTDLNCLSVVQYAVEVLKVTDIIVCGHYGCGGVQAALDSKAFGLIDNWLRHIKDAAHLRREELAKFEGQARKDRMCEINVEQQVANLTHSTIVQDAWNRGQKLTVHGFIYSLSDGLLRDLEQTVTDGSAVPPIYKMT